MRRAISKALRGELRFILPPGYCWNEIGQIEMDPDARIGGVIRLLFDKFRELGSARQVLLWAQDQALQLPITRRNNSSVCKIEWRPAAYHTVLQILRHPVYAGAYVFGRTTQRTRIVDGRARKTTGHSKPMTAWNVLIRDHHPGYIGWEQYEANQKLISENAHMQRRTERKSARGGRALLTGLVRCGRCGRTMRVFYGTSPAMLIVTIAEATTVTSAAGCVSALAAYGLIVPSPRKSSRPSLSTPSRRQPGRRSIGEGRQRDPAGHCTVSSRKHATKPSWPPAATSSSIRPSVWSRANSKPAGTRRWSGSLILEDRIARHDAAAALRPKVDRDALLALARDLPTAWNAPGTDARTKQRITHILIREVMLDLDDATNEALVSIHWNGGRHTELRVSRVRTGRYPADRHPSPVEAIRKLGGQLPDRELAVTLNRMRCKPPDGKAWTTVRVREVRERLGIGAYDPGLPRTETISADVAATRLGICVGSVHKLIRKGLLPATQLMTSAPWQIPVAALDTQAVRTGVREIVGRRPKYYKRFQQDKSLWLPGLLKQRMYYVIRSPRRPRNTNSAPPCGSSCSVS